MINKCLIHTIADDRKPVSLFGRSSVCSLHLSGKFNENIPVYKIILSLL